MNNLFTSLEDANFKATLNYLQKEATMEEFEEDLELVNYIKKQFLKYKRGRKFNPRLTLNYFICLFNVFETKFIIDYIHYILGNTYKVNIMTTIYFLNKITKFQIKYDEYDEDLFNIYDKC